MWNFPYQRVLFPTASGELFKKVNHRLVEQSTKQCKAYLSALESHPDLSPEFLQWMKQRAQKNSPSLRLACGQPKLMRLMLGSDSEQRNKALPEIFQTHTHIPRDSAQQGTQFKNLTQWVDPLRKFTVSFSGIGEARVGQSTVDLFDDKLSAETPFLRIHARREHPEYLLASIDGTRRVAHHKYWRFGLQNIVLENPADWSDDQIPCDSVGGLARSELVALQNANALLTMHIPHWATRLCDLVSYFHYAPDEIPNELLPKVCYIRADDNPIVVAERILRAEADANFRASNGAMQWVNEDLSVDELYSCPTRNTELDALIELASCTRVAIFHACLHARHHPCVELTSMRERREKLMDDLSERREELERSDSLTDLGKHLLKEATACQKWAQQIATASRPRLNISRPKKILMINLDFQDAVYSYLFQRTFCLLATQRRHDVDVIRPHPTKAGTNLPCELGVEDESLPPGEQNEVLLESDDLDAAHVAISRQIQSNDYDAIVVNVRVQTLYYLLEETPKDLSGIPIIAYDRHLHHDLDTYGVTPERIENLQRHQIYVNGLVEIGLGGADAQKRRDAGMDMSRVHQWPWAVDESFFIHARSTRKQTSDLPPANPGKMTLFSGGNSKRDYKTLFEAVTDLPVDLRVATNLNFEELPSNVSILGRVFLHEFRNEIRNCDAVVIPLGARDEEGIGAVGITVIALAFALEKPIISTGSKFLAEYITTGESGLLVPPFDTEAMREAICLLQEDEGLRSTLAKNGKKSSFSTEDFAEAILDQVDGVFDSIPTHPKRVPPSINEPLSIAILHMNARHSWDLHRLLEVQAFIRSEHRVPCEVIDIRDPSTDPVEFGAGADDLPDRPTREAVLDRLHKLRANYVIVDKCPSAYAYLKSCEEFGQELAPTVLITDYHMLGRVELIQQNFNKGDARNMLGQWWPAPHIQLLSCYPSFWGLYERAGLSFHNIRWLPLASQKRLTRGKPPSECNYAVAGGIHMRDLELISKVLTDLPERYRHRIRYFGAEPDIDWEKTGIRYEGRHPFNSFYFDTLCNARFMISPAKVDVSSFGGVSTADITRSAGRPLLAPQNPPLRDALGGNNTVFCSQGNDKELTEAIIRCFEDDAFVDQIYDESESLCAANSTKNYANYLVQIGKGWRAPFDS